MKTIEYFRERSKVDANGCWVWQLYAFPNGYGGFSEHVNRTTQTTSAHRGAWAAAHGPIAHGSVVCHRCDNRLCCNPEHLFLGTQSDNIKDMVAKGRGNPRRGEDHHNSKLTAGDVRMVKLLLGLGVRQYRLSQLYGVGQQTISAINTGASRVHVDAIPSWVEVAT